MSRVGLSFFFTAQRQSVSWPTLPFAVPSLSAALSLLHLSLPVKGKAKHHLLTLHPLMHWVEQWHQLNHLRSGLPLEAPSSGPCMGKLVHVHMQYQDAMTLLCHWPDTSSNNATKWQTCWLSPSFAILLGHWEYCKSHNMKFCINP